MATGRGQANQAEVLQVGPRISLNNTPNVHNKPPIFNLSDHLLSSPEISLLSKGLSFVITEKPDFFRLQSELRRFFRTLRLKAYFLDKPYVGTPSFTNLRLPSTFTPSTGSIPSELVTFEKVVIRDVLALQNTHIFTPYNITLEERHALNELKENHNVVIKPADKGGGIVLQNTENYQAEITSQLNEATNYTRLRADPQASLRKKIYDVTFNAKEKGFLSKLEFDFLNRPGPRTPVLYTLPKIHKRLTNPPGRPILSGCGSILEPLGQYIDYFIKDMVPLQETYVRDSTYMVNLVEGMPFSETNQLLVTMDIQSLYTSIPQLDSIGAIKKVLDARPQPSPVPTSFIIELLTIALTENYLKHTDAFYQQRSGTSMGAVFAPSLANIYVDSDRKSVGVGKECRL